MKAFKYIMHDAKGEEHTINGERSRDSVIPADEGVLCRVVSAAVHDRQLVEFSLHNDPELLAHLDLHTVFQPSGWHIEV